MKRILLVDDDLDDIQTFSDAVSELNPGMIVDYFEDGHRALLYIVRNRASLPDIIFLDINMPAIDGWECLKEFKQLAILQNIPIVMYSTANLQSTGISAADVGAAAFLMKPDTFRELKKQLTELFHQLF
jgi:CheY-like chemotaxis protein